MLRFIQGFLVCWLIVFSVWFLNGQAPLENPEARVYCEMRKIFDDTNGEFGWPNYRKEIECTNGEVK
jgi:hypothetical protein